ncbi:hypothetical protein E3N88_32476 [Mikania micrantha]|uniref:Uncharacterized protein n=1 Tax=Mikania micrantha TaxID=192012 RepID=A0A5N6M955_9ASTR|nr:hypothetical protein E3N88_32476 [Mikania micrantha]
MSRLYEGWSEILKIQKFRRAVGKTIFFSFSALISYAYNSNTTRAGYSRGDQFYASYPAGSELLTDTTKLYKSALGNCFEVEEWGPIEWPTLPLMDILMEVVNIRILFSIFDQLTCSQLTCRSENICIDMTEGVMKTKWLFLSKIDFPPKGVSGLSTGIGGNQSNINEKLVVVEAAVEEQQ